MQLRIRRGLIRVAVLAATALATNVTQAGAGLNWASASDLLAVGLPAVAAGTNWSRQDAEGLRTLVLTLGTALGGTEALKSALPAWRPDRSDQKSFPSGHTAIAFAAARHMDKRLGPEIAAWRAVVYGAATLTAVARVQADKHYWKDVLAGAALGWVSAELWTSPVQGGQMALVPMPGGMTLIWHTPLP